MSGDDKITRGQGEPAPYERVRAILSSYGANPDRWPAEERAAAGIALAGSAGLRNLAVEEGTLDASMSAAGDVFASATLRARLVADFEAFAERQSRKLHTRLLLATDAIKEFVWPGAPWWKPAFALSLSIVVGVSAGLLVLGPLTDQSEGDQVVASLIDAPQSADLELDD
jgi:hypothetical protein